MAHVSSRLAARSAAPLLVLCCFLALARGGRMEKRETNENQVDKMNEQQEVVSEAVADFGIGFLNTMEPGDKKNLVMSPLSLHILLDMVHLGTEDRSGTQRDLARVLGYETIWRRVSGLADRGAVHKVLATVNRRLLDSIGPQSKLSMANIVASNTDRVSLKGDFKKEIVEHFSPVEFETFRKGEHAEAARRVNRWVSEKTNKMISDLLDPDSLGEDLVAVLANAVYFQGEWSLPFERRLTQERVFYNGGLESASKRVPFMEQSERFGFAEGANFKLLKMPFRGAPMAKWTEETHGNQLYMVFLLPNKRDGIDQMLAGLKASDLKSAMDEIRWLQVKVNLPKFTFESKIDARRALEKMGLQELFKEANLKRMFNATKDKHKVDQVVQKAKIVVNEEGAEAAAASAAGIAVLTSIGHSVEPVKFDADHPFVYFILHQATRMPLFMGRVDEL